ncbi:MAG: hypothetical protein EHM65_06835 [Acidobacteriales bacterium]|nr:MAG: hypothetical protein EHM65_06835 [Terriglobales bacterium]
MDSLPEDAGDEPLEPAWLADDKCPKLFAPPPVPAKRRGGRPKGSKNKPKPVDLILKASEFPAQAPRVVDIPAPPPPHKPIKAPVTTLEGQTQWYCELLKDDAVPVKEKREAMREIADLHGLKRVKDFANMSTKSTEELHKLLREVLEIWKVAGVLQVIDPGGDSSYLQN